MRDVLLEVLTKIYDYGYEAYCVGGFVRDYIIGISSNDMDITTNATPMELVNIFPNISIDPKNYGSGTLFFKNYRFDITTYRKDGNYLDNRHPDEIVYINDLKTDLLRRDFTINSICMDKDGNIVDLLGGVEDIHNRVIRCINDSDKSFNDDALRILRAVRFSSTLGFNLDDSVITSINKNKYLLKNISYNRKKSELDKIFVSNNCREGIDLIKKLGLVNILELDNINRVRDYTDLVGIWSMINSKCYPFTSSERDLIKKINIVYDMDNLDKFTLYKYGLYVNKIAGVNKGISNSCIVKMYDSLNIKEKSDINIKGNDIADILGIRPGKIINDIFCDLEIMIINNKLNNDYDSIKEYIISKYK